MDLKHQWENIMLTRKGAATEERWAIYLSVHYKLILLSSFLKPEIWYLYVKNLVTKGYVS